MSFSKSSPSDFTSFRFFFFQGEFSVKLEIEQVSQKDKGVYKLVAKNEKGEATSQTVELTEIPEEKEEKPEKIQIAQGLTSAVSFSFRQASLEYYPFWNWRLPHYKSVTGSGRREIGQVFLHSQVSGSFRQSGLAQVSIF